MSTWRWQQELRPRRRRSATDGSRCGELVRRVPPRPAGRAAQLRSASALATRASAADAQALHAAASSLALQQDSSHPVQQCWDAESRWRLPCRMDSRVPQRAPRPARECFAGDAPWTWRRRWDYGLSAHANAETRSGEVRRRMRRGRRCAHGGPRDAALRSICARAACGTPRGRGVAEPERRRRVGTRPRPRCHRRRRCAGIVLAVRRRDHSGRHGIARWSAATPPSANDANKRAAAASDGVACPCQQTDGGTLRPLRSSRTRCSAYVSARAPGPSDSAAYVLQSADPSMVFVLGSCNMTMSGPKPRPCTHAKSHCMPTSTLSPRPMNRPAADISPLAWRQRREYLARWAPVEAGL